ncbi:MAG: CAP domain-containing protein [Pyrinomonadaceae bacterium]
MRTKIFLLLGTFASFTATSFAQPSFPNIIEFNNGGANLVTELTRPRIVPNKASSVKASVVLNTVSLEQTAFELLNQKRIHNGLQPLVWNEKVAAIARLHSQNMADLKFFSHRGRDDKMVSDRADDAGLGRWRAIGENIAYNRGYQDPIAKAVELWLDSPSHRHNLLDNSWKETAIGIAVTADGSYYLTQVFLKK